MKKNIARKSFLSSTNHIIITLLGFVAMFVIKRYMGYEAVGIMAFAVSFATLFLIFGDLGFGVSHLKRVTEGHDIGMCNSTIVTVKFFLTLLMALVFILVIGVQKFIFDYEYESHTMEIVVYLLALNYMFLNFGRAFRNIFTAQLQMTRAQIPRLIAKLIVVSLKIFAAVAGFSIVYLAYAELVGTFFLIAMWVLYVLKTQTFSRPNMTYIKLYAVFALPMLFLGLVGTITHSLDKVMLGYFAGSFNVGVYAIPQRMTAAFLIIAASLTSILFVSFSEFYSKKDFHRIQTISHQAERYISIIMLPVVVFVFVFAKELLLIFGDDTGPSIPVLRILIIALYMDSIRGAYSVQVVSTGHIKLGLYVAIMTLVMNIVLNFLFIPDWGFNHIYLSNTLLTTGAAGAAFATFITLTTRGIVAKYCAFRITYTKPNLRMFFHYIAAVITYYIIAYAYSTYNPSLTMILFYPVFTTLIFLSVLIIFKEFTRKDFFFYWNVINPKKMLNYIKSEIRFK